MINQVVTAPFLLKFFFVISIVFVVFLSYYFSYLRRSATHTLFVSDQERKYLLKEPATTADKKYPLLIAIHGYSDFPRLMELYSGFSKKADTDGWFVAYPYGTNSEQEPNLSWNAGSCCKPALTQDTQDVAFISQLIETLIKEKPIDPDAIFVVGFSNGGMLTYRLLAEKPDQIAAAAVVAGSIGGKVDAEQPYFTVSKLDKERIPLLIIHGDADVRVPFSGGENNTKDAEFSSFADSVAFVADSYNCDASIQEETSSTHIKQKYTNCVGTDLLTTHQVINGEHTWFGNPWEKIKHPFSQHFETSEVVWSFFSDKQKNK